MAVSAEQTVNAPVQKVVETFLDESFNRHVSERGRTTFVSQTVEGDPSGAFTVTLVRSMGADRLPDMAKKFIKDGLTITQVDSWAAPQADGSRDVRTEITVGGMPASGQGTQLLKAEGEKTQVSVEMTLTTKIPLVGAKIAAAAEPYVGKALSLQAREANAWIASH
ncbi:DUF2505 domain-containing protein [Kocuria coralli]|uniref:DUF2505 domain-containing protein n=1 Tax=Kocuria coralli TaxID=1461025 RepID=A0A5J5KTU6_9MICC|nr:DUF2505 domain-containing protein [Kocuria coralli]KAA9393149.1 DUF2505 domain-containing protein [Kocuria coralli]